MTHWDLCRAIFKVFNEKKRASAELEKRMKEDESGENTLNCDVLILIETSKTHFLSLPDMNPNHFKMFLLSSTTAETSWNKTCKSWSAFTGSEHNRQAVHRGQDEDTLNPAWTRCSRLDKRDTIGAFTCALIFWFLLFPKKDNPIESFFMATKINIPLLFQCTRSCVHISDYCNVKQSVLANLPPFLLSANCSQVAPIVFPLPPALA